MAKTTILLCLITHHLSSSLGLQRELFYCASSPNEWYLMLSAFAWKGNPSILVTSKIIPTSCIAKYKCWQKKLYMDGDLKGNQESKGSVHIICSFVPPRMIEVYSSAESQFTHLPFHLEKRLGPSIHLSRHQGPQVS